MTVFTQYGLDGIRAHLKDWHSQSIEEADAVRLAKELLEHIDSTQQGA